MRCNVKNMTSHHGIPGSFRRAAQRIFTIIRTRNVYGYNSVMVGIMRSLRRSKPGGRMWKIQDTPE
jgi:hypothetical protein